MCFACLFVASSNDWHLSINQAKKNVKKEWIGYEMKCQWMWTSVCVCMCVSVFCYAQNGRAMWCGRFGGVGGGERMHIYFFYIYVLRLHSYTNIIFIDFFFCLLNGKFITARTYQRASMQRNHGNVHCLRGAG